MKKSKKILPLVSIVLPVYNRAKLLPRCISSVLNQSYSNWELLTIDDGSSDNSSEVLSEYSKVDKRIVLFIQKHKKLPLTRNKGIKESSGDYITFIDSDDEYKKDHLQKRVNFLIAHPGVDLIHGGIEIIGDKYVRDKNNPEKLIHISKCSVGGTFFGKRIVFENLGRLGNYRNSNIFFVCWNLSDFN